MNRSFDIFRMGANGVDPDRGTGRADQVGRGRTSHSAEPPFEHGIHHHPDHPDHRDEWGQHAQQLDRSADYGGYGDRDRYTDEREHQRGLERSDAWRHQGEGMERGRYHQGMSRMAGVTEMSGFPHTSYGNTARNEPYPPSRSNPNVWRGRNEDYDFWGRERHDDTQQHQQQQGGHPSLWQRVRGAFSGKGPKNYVRSDERIHEDVCEHLTHHPYIDASDIEVVVHDGEVTLSGTVDARMVKRAAEEACDHVRGVKDVHNHLRVRPATA
jgi:hypothetical protein